MDDALLSALSGSIAGMGALALTYPLVVASTRDAVRSSPSSSNTNDGRDRGNNTSTSSKSYAAVVKEEPTPAEKEKPTTAKKHQDGGPTWAAAAAGAAALQKVLTTLPSLSPRSSDLYAGLPSSLVGIATTNLVYYFLYSLLSAPSRRKSLSGETLTVRQAMVAGALAGAGTTVVTNPLWVVQAHQATFATLHHHRDDDDDGGVEKEGKGERKKVKVAPAAKATATPSMRESIRRLYDQDGLAAFWRGLQAALLLVANPVLQYAAFEKLKALLLALRHRQSLARLSSSTGRSSPTTATAAAATAAAAMGRGPGVALSSIELFALGALAKLFATGLSYPLVLLKSRLQSASHAYPSLPAALRSIVHQEGLAGLYKGVGPKLIQSVLTAALLLAGQQRVYEGLVRALGGGGGRRKGGGAAGRK